MNGMNINFYLNYWYGEAPADAMKSLMDNLAASTTSCTCRRATASTSSRPIRSS